MSFLNPLESVIFLPTALGKIGQKCLIWVILVKIAGKISQFRHFWAILLIAVAKKITDSNGFKWVKFINFFLYVLEIGKKFWITV
jgi:isoprenylcysteine carboxyl methyltransferase (ICMT) family protein YpbQ